MSKWLADYLVESHASLASGSSKLIFKHPHGIYEVHLSDNDVTPGIKTPTLNVQVILESDNYKDVEDLSEQYLGSFLKLLSFLTNCKFNILSLRRIIEWTPGLVTRQYIQIDEFNDPTIPLAVLDDSIIKSLEDILSTDVTSSLHNVFRCFSNALSSSYQDEQFQFFWFAIEILSQLYKDRTPVPDLCPRCRNPLYCQKCQETPQHKPYEKQAIEQLIRDNVQGENIDTLIDTTFKIRNSLLHGETIQNIEKNIPYKSIQVINFLGKTVWIILLNLIRKALRDEGKSSMFKLFEVNNFLHYLLKTETVGSINRPECADDPQIEKIPPVLKVSIITHDEPEEANN